MELSLVGRTQAGAMVCHHVLQGVHVKTALCTGTSRCCALVSGDIRCRGTRTEATTLHLWKCCNALTATFAIAPLCRTQGYATRDSIRHMPAAPLMSAAATPSAFGREP